MTMTTRKNQSVKALQSAMAAAKKYSSQALLEWEISCNTNAARGHIYNQSELHELYSRRRDYNGRRSGGASKQVHTVDHTGNEFEYIVVKRHKVNGYIPNAAEESAWGHHGFTGTGNQLVDEINCWVKFAEKPESDLLAPILKYFTSKSDQVTAVSETMQSNVVIIAQKAVYVSDAYSSCEKAEELNAENGYTGESPEERYSKMKRLAKSQNWRDALHNGGNSGVVFDYSKGCYKAVFIDYAL